ncbi:hypothetical protein BJ166DRAFT_61388 [Pestalotiopsis sp. NC0098]|nr:hypothetical protein BJ166DRAFT_61388 [Pestalotiopsis sp. NC0098]
MSLTHATLCLYVEGGGSPIAWLLWMAPIAIAKIFPGVTRSARSLARCFNRFLQAPLNFCHLHIPFIRETCIVGHVVDFRRSASDTRPLQNLERRGQCREGPAICRAASGHGSRFVATTNYAGKSLHPKQNKTP